MQQFVTSLVLLALTLSAQAQDGTKFTANFAPKAPTGFGSSAERGNALGHLTSAGSGTNLRLVVVDRDANQLLFLNATTGAEVGTLSTSTLSGGFYNVNDASITSDGALVVCNLTLNASTSAFKCYTSPDDDGPFTEIVNYTSASADRLGDKITAVGSMSGGTLSIYAASASAGRVYRFDSGVFGSPTILSLVEEDGATSVTTIGSSPSIGPEGTGVSDFWVNGNGINPMKFTAAGQRVGTLTGVVTGTGNNAIRAFSKGSARYIATFEYSTSAPTYGRVAIVDVTGFPTSTPALYDRGLNVGGGASGLGDVDLLDNGDGTYTVCVLGTNFGVTCGVTNSAPLPVELVSFEGLASGSSATLRWTTASETNNAGFDIQHRLGDTFHSIGFVNGHGTSAEHNRYSFDVPALTPGQHSFRLVQRDFDGALWTSSEITVEVASEQAFSLSALQPNPAHSSARTSVFVERPQQVTVEVFDAAGRRVATLFDGLMAEGTTTLDVQAGSLPAGLYLVRAMGERLSKTTTLTVLR